MLRPSNRSLGKAWACCAGLLLTAGLSPLPAAEPKQPRFIQPGSPAPAGALAEVEEAPLEATADAGLDESGWLDESAGDIEQPRVPAQTASMSEYSEYEAAPAAGPDAAAKKKAADLKKKKADLKKAVNGAYKGVFYENDFKYINNPLYDQCFIGDSLKQIPVGDCWTLDLGGQYRARYHHEQNIRGLGLTGRDDDFLLHRTRLFVNAKYDDFFRFYAEYIDAESNYENFAPRGIEVDRSDLLNLFGEVKLLDDFFDGKLTARVGRQELLYGSQRLISPLDWGNTRRTFEGLNFVFRNKDWAIDTFVVEPVAVDPHNFNSAIDEQEFIGTFATFKKIKDQTFDFYALQYNNSSAPQHYKFTTLGSRWLGTDGDLLYELEGGVQFGKNTDGSDHSAGFATGGVGKSWDKSPGKPTLWVYYDWAQGSDDRARGNGFNQLFPLAHKYLGFMDLFGRENIESPNVQLTVKPNDKTQLLIWYYYFFLENANDTPYNVNSTPFAPGATPANADLGHELDLAATRTINPRMELVLGYSHFWAGKYYKLTPGVPYRNNADFYYVQYTWNF